jgi:hypothetical protein
MGNMIDLNMSKEALFKQVFSKSWNAAPLLQAALPPALAQRIDWRSFAASWADDMEALFGDLKLGLLFSARLAGRPVLLSLLFEQRGCDDLLPLRMLKCATRVLEWHCKVAALGGETRLPLPLVIPVAIHQDNCRWPAVSGIERLFDVELRDNPAFRGFVPQLTLVFKDVTQLSDDSLEQRWRALLPVLALLAMRDWHDPAAIASSVRGWVEVAAQAEAGLGRIP